MFSSKLKAGSIMKKTIITLMLTAIITATIAQTRPAGSGIQLIWAPEYGDTISSVRSIQGYYIWKNVQPTPTTWNWNELHSDLLRSRNLNKPIVVQLNMPAPDWIADSVAILGISRGGPAPQFWDTTWRNIYTRVLVKFAQEIATDTNKQMIVAIRVQPNGYNTEYILYDPTEFDQGNVPDEDDYNTWLSFPAGYSAGSPKYPHKRTDIVPGTSDMYFQHYMKAINEVFKAQFWPLGIKTAWRTLLLGNNFTAGYVDSIFAKKDSVMTLDTRCGLNPQDGMPNRYARMTAQTDSCEGYWEDSQYPWYTDGTFTTTYSQQKNIGWRNFFRLDAKIAYCAVYGSHITYDSSFAFVNKYAGYGRLPKLSPGAWVVFHGSAVKPDNLGMFIRQSNLEETDVLTHVGQDWRTAWMRKVDANKSINLYFDNDFYSAVKCKKCTIRITYWNQAGQNWKFEGKPEVVGSGSGSVETVIYSNYRFRKKTFKISATSGEPILHMVEISKL